MASDETLLLTRRDVAGLLGIEECIAAVEHAFRSYGEGETRPPGILGVHATDGGFHVKAGIMDLDRSYFVAKTNANFPNNHELGLPTIQGLVVVCDAADGRLLAVMDSIELTIIRTGAATAVAAKYLARENSNTVLICGCGNQGRISVKAIATVRQLKKVFAYDIDPVKAQRFADELSADSDIEITVIDDIAVAARESDICVTCTPSREFFLRREHVSPGTFVAAVGSDSEIKQELEPSLLAGSKIVTDITEQTATIGELHHALKDGCVSCGDVYAELGEIVAGLKAGRESKDEIIVFDSTGMALQDVATAAIVYERASTGKRFRTRINFND